MNRINRSLRISTLALAAAALRCSDSKQVTPTDGGPSLDAAVPGPDGGNLDGAASSSDSPASCGDVPSAAEQRFEAMRGPLGCAATQTVVPDPPDGCTGADQLLADARREYAALWAAGSCGTSPPSLAPVVDAYDQAYAAQHPFAAATIPRGDFSIAAREFGAAHTEGPTIVLMHGFPDNQHLYDLVAPALGETFHTITFDFVGWGDSSRPPSDYVFTYDGLRQDLEAVLSHFGATSVVPVVHDASGWPGIDWALDNPNSVKALVLLNTTYHPVPTTAPPNVIRALSALDLRPTFIDAAGTDELMGRALFHAQVSRFFVDPTKQSTFLPLFESEVLSIRPGLYGLTASLVDALIARIPDIPRMHGFPRPVVVAFGADDPYLNDSVAQAFASTFAHAELEPIAQAGHYVSLDQPDRVVAVIRAAAEGP